MSGIRDASLDKTLADIADNCNKLSYVTSDNVTPGAAMSGLTVLGEVSLTVGNGNGDYVIADYSGTGGGRKLMVAAKNVVASASGDAKSWVLNDGTTVFSADTFAPKTFVSGSTYEGPVFVGAVVKDATSITA